jgi:hypothetical protein
MNDFLPTIIRADATNIEYAKKAAQEDNHHIIGGSHLILKHGEVVGYLGIATIPTVTMWLHTQKTKVRDALAVINFVDNTIADRFLPNGKGVYFMPMSGESPFNNKIELVGFEKTNYNNVFIKAL